jgi:hypothetical protein
MKAKNNLLKIIDFVKCDYVCQKAQFPYSVTILFLNLSPLSSSGCSCLFFPCSAGNKLFMD